MKIEDHLMRAFVRATDEMMLGGASCTATTGPTTTLDLATVEAAIEAFRKTLGPEPFEQWMTLKGAPPRDGWRLLLPEAWQRDRKDLLPAHLPWYVRHNALVLSPIFVHDTCGLWPEPIGKRSVT